MPHWFLMKISTLPSLLLCPPTRRIGAPRQPGKMKMITVRINYEGTIRKDMHGGSNGIIMDYYTYNFLHFVYSNRPEIQIIIFIGSMQVCMSHYILTPNASGSEIPRSQFKFGWKYSCACEITLQSLMLRLYTDHAGPCVI